ncbi:MAG: polysaccharide deacetylase family protein [Candidatus Peribacteraceae bacterium]|jgi:peptidoglycan/xylan/chitin deacetylase (PgdA/CDA1 family)|nr:polysaccharide deacetylase family protein [Candidatus Peribacteraceae bacterium]MDP7454446.1 polysaccharide deacetylase family protein [Candidatus Peribacteraceae bacterium]MDP7646411.1 polysaccharide deacetylase family protein [Candidatus Peribacteraceae bacterium]
MLFTTSWDDGYVLDLAIASLLEKYDCKGTFYICPEEQHNRDMLKPEQIKDLNSRHEVGAHSMTHPKLTKVSLDEAKWEIESSKKWIEEITGEECKSFCYPFGLHNDEVKGFVRDAGFENARTVENIKFSSSDPLAMPTSLQITPFPWRKKWTLWWHPLDHFGPARALYGDIRKLGISIKSCTSWLSLAKAIFTYAKKTDQPYFHLWGHSHEVEKYKMWGQLESFLEFVKDEGVDGVTNGELRIGASENWR